MITFLGAFDDVKTMPRTAMLEFAFVGRSNVGKSSVLNLIAEQKIARTSNTPGRTQTINLFSDNIVYLADLPGYGYARAAKTDILKWERRLEIYLTTRSQLKKLFILIDARHGIKDSDAEIMNFCDINAVRYQIVLTKADKVSRADSVALANSINAELKLRGAATGDVIITSANKKIGMDELKDAIWNN